MAAVLYVQAASSDVVGEEALRRTRTWWLRDGRYAPMTEKGDSVFGLPFDGWILRLTPAESPVVSAALEDKAAGLSVFGMESQKGTFKVEGQKVTAGEFIYFVVDARSDGTAAPHSGDGTRLEVTLTVRDAVIPPPPSFEKDILPLLASKCHDCHGGDVQEGRLDLRTLAAILRGGENGPAAVPGRPVHSLLLDRVLAGEMPPDKSARLSPDRRARAGGEADFNVREDL